jgi:transposase
MEVLFDRVAGLDVHRDALTACTRVPRPSGRGRLSQVAEFPTTTAGLGQLHACLVDAGVSHVAMEATGIYWRPVFWALETDFELLLVNAAHVKHVPGRKTDVADATWLGQLLECGLLRSSFVPLGRSADCAISRATARRSSTSAAASCSVWRRRCRRPASS